VWHASAAPGSWGPVRLLACALAALRGVGDAERGEWIEFTGAALHVRRRLSEAEEALVGPAVDVRGTEEAVRRYQTLLRSVPAQLRPLLRLH
jgi:hypothetical protein